MFVAGHIVTVLRMGANKRERFERVQIAPLGRAIMVNNIIIK